MPAAAVIPAPIAYINVVAVKKLVVEFLEFVLNPGALFIQALCIVIFQISILVVIVTGIRLSGAGAASFTVNKIECLKQALRLEYFSME